MQEGRASLDIVELFYYYYVLLNAGFLAKAQHFGDVYKAGLLQQHQEREKTGCPPE